ncbi:hypothetical protein D3C87_1653970 [compost metagenome]
MALEDIAKDYFKKGINCCVYNCPEILTNSSSIFQGVEVSLYPLLAAIQKDGADKNHVATVLKECKDLLKDDVTFEQIIRFTDDYLTNDLTLEFSKYELWPQNSAQHQMEYMLNSSDHLFSLHKDEKNLITAVLSEVVFKSCGYVMLHDSWKPKSPVAWINHDVVARCM